MFPKDTNILVVDDMMTMRKLVKKSLTELGFSRFTEAENGQVALEKFKMVMGNPSTQFNLVISDWNMPQMTGIDFLRSVRSIPGGGQVPFILLTAESEKSQVIEALKARVSGYVIKPFTTQMLGDKLKAVYFATAAVGKKPAA